MAGLESLSAPLLVWIALVILVSGVLQGALGLGFPTVATPLIALVTDIRTAVVVVLLPCIATVVIAAVKGVPLRRVLAEFWMMPLYMLLGAGIGTRLFIAYPAFPYTLLLAAVIIVYLNLDRLGRSEWPPIRRHRHFFGFLFGLLAGLSEGTANVAAPPLIIYYLAIGVQPTMLVQALNICFLAGKSAQFATLATVGGVPAAQWLATLPLAAVAAVGALYGVRIRSRIDASTYKMWVKSALFAIAIILCAQYAYSNG
jgi:uncharacterized membrane protein YfcA